jgi:hypothetical protein
MEFMLCNVYVCSANEEIVGVFQSTLNQCKIIIIQISSDIFACTRKLEDDDRFKCIRDNF